MLELFFIGWLSGNKKITTFISYIFYNSISISVALLATVIIWLHDFNNNGLLNMTPLEREQVSKAALTHISTSINDNGAYENDELNTGSGQAREVRNKYLNRIGVVDSANSSDTEPLLQ